MKEMKNPVRRNASFKNPVYESKVEFNPINGNYKETELFNSGMFDKVRYLRTKIVNGEHCL